MLGKYNWELVMKAINIYFSLGGVTENPNPFPKPSSGSVNTIENW